MPSDIIATMNTEFEIKFLDIAEDLVKNQLKEQKARQLKPKTLMKRQVFHPNKIDEAGDTWARVRDEGDKITMSVKHAVESNRIDCVKEAEVVVNSFAQACDLLLGLGLNPSSYQENYRETWALGRCEVTIDTWPGLNPFVEIEGEDENSVRQVSEALGFAYEDGVFGSIDIIYAKKYAIPRKFITTAKRLTFEGFALQGEKIFQFGLP